jgi:hypothetical protein
MVQTFFSKGEAPKKKGKIWSKLLPTKKSQKASPAIAVASGNNQGHDDIVSICFSYGTCLIH